jgi:hypothetical protein
VASLVRWWLQGSGNLYTTTEKRFYVEDPDVGWVESEHTAVWLGLEVCAVVVALTAGVAIAGWLVARRERGGRSTRAQRIATWLVAVPAVIVPLAAFASGWRPAGGRDLLPTTTTEVAASEIAGSLDAPAGRYEIVAHAGTAITARLRAGGEAFDARFARDITGAWDGDPRELARPMRAEVRVATAAVDTGVTARSNSARDGYLQGGEHPTISFTLERVIGARQEGPGKLAFRAPATLGFVGRSHAIEVTGTLSRPDAAAVERLGLTGTILLVQASFSLVIADTALAPDASDFDEPQIPIHVSLVLRHTEPRSQP